MPTLLVTGAGGGIGRAVCAAALDDWEVLAVGRAAADDAGDVGLRRIAADVTDPAQLQDLFEQLERDHRVPDAVVHCVGTSFSTPLERVEPAQVDEVLRVNLVSAIHLLAALQRSRRRHPRPMSVVLFASVVSRVGVAHHEVIAAAKAGIEGLVRAAAASHAGSGLRINAIAPGLTETPMTARMLSSEVGRSAAEKQYPLGGINRAQDVAAAALWLVSPHAARITGQVLAVDGGFTAVRPMVR